MPGAGDGRTGGNAPLICRVSSDDSLVCYRLETSLGGGGGGGGAYGGGGEGADGGGGSGDDETLYRMHDVVGFPDVQILQAVDDLECPRRN